MNSGRCIFSQVLLASSGWHHQGYNKIKKLLTSHIHFSRQYFLVLFIDLRPGQTCHSKVMHRKEVTHSDSSYEKKSRRRIWLTIWDKVKSHGTGKNWCTGRGWPLNCITIISAWWWSNMPVQRRREWHIPAWLAMRIDIEWAIELLYNSVMTGSQSVGDQMSWWQDVVEKASRKLSPRASGWAVQENEKDNNADGHNSGGQYAAVLFGLQLPLTVKPWVTLSNTFK